MDCMQLIERPERVFAVLANFLLRGHGGSMRRNWRGREVLRRCSSSRWYLVVGGPLKRKQTLPAAAQAPMGPTHPGYVGDAPTPSTGQPKTANIIGVDDRFSLPYGTVYPYRTVAALNSNGHGCTKTLIGASTAISAAHCYHNGSGWLPTSTWSFNANSTAGVVNPYNPWGAYPSTASNSAVLGCYTVTVPGCWDGSNEDCDYAVIEFSNMYPNCNLYPGNTLGWLGWGAESSATIRAYEAEMYGYAQDAPCAGGSCEFPLLWGQTQDPGRIGPCGLTHQMCTQFDATGGDSGSAIWNNAPGYPEVIGIMWGWVNSDPTYNRIVRLDSVSTNFIATYSAL